MIYFLLLLIIIRWFVLLIYCLFWQWIISRINFIFFIILISIHLRINLLIFIYLINAFLILLLLLRKLSKIYHIFHINTFHLFFWVRAYRNMPSTNAYIIWCLTLSCFPLPNLLRTFHFILSCTKSLIWFKWWIIFFFFFFFFIIFLLFETFFCKWFVFIICIIFFFCIFFFFNIFVLFFIILFLCFHFFFFFFLFFFLFFTRMVLRISLFYNIRSLYSLSIFWYSMNFWSSRFFNLPLNTSRFILCLT